MNDSTTPINADKWIENYQAYLFNYAKSRVNNLLDIEEIIQDTFLAALKSKDNFQNRSTERTWLTTILRHKIVDYYRYKSSLKGKMKHYSISHEEYTEYYHKEVATSLPEETTLSKFNLESLENLLAEALSFIPNSQSNVVRLRVFDQLNTEEICDKLNISKNNAWVLMNRARKKIATHFAKNDYYV